jgi:hypothetical protein
MSSTLSATKATRRHDAKLLHAPGSRKLSGKIFRSTVHAAVGTWSVVMAGHGLCDIVDGQQLWVPGVASKTIKVV